MKLKISIDRPGMWSGLWKWILSVIWFVVLQIIACVMITVLWNGSVNELFGSTREVDFNSVHRALCVLYIVVYMTIYTISSTFSNSED